MRPHTFVENYSYCVKICIGSTRASNFSNSNAKLPEGNEKKTVLL